MAWHKSNRSGTSRSFPSTSRIRRHHSVAVVTDNDISHLIQQSVVRVNVTLECKVKNETVEFEKALNKFKHKFATHSSHVVTERHHVRMQLIQCGLNQWQDLAELQRVLAALKRPNNGHEERQVMTEMLVHHDVKCNEWKLQLKVEKESEDAVWQAANSLMLRLKSCGIMSKVLLPSDQLILSLGTAVGDCEKAFEDEYHWKGTLVWNQVVVTMAGGQRDQIQRVILPPIREVATTYMDELRYPKLLTYMDTILSSSLDSTTATVIILRGIPGSGKSTIRHDIVKICQHKKVAITTCSADFFFETQRGYVYDMNKIGAAHRKCKADFTNAVTKPFPRSNEDDCPQQHVVVVDNTHTQRWEYKPYEDIAKIHRNRVHIVELKCPDVLTAYRFGQRNSHGVPADKVVSMFQRWEEDSRANYFDPYFEHPTLSANPLSDGVVQGFTYLGLFLDFASKKKLMTQVPMVHSNKFAEHVTMFYQPNKQYARIAELGAMVTIRGVEVVNDSRGQALRVELDERLPLQVKNKIPHITLSTNAGVRPSYSNDLLNSSAGKRTVFDPPIDLSAHIGAAFYIQNQQMNTITSPFAVGMDYLRPLHDDCELADKNTTTNPDLFIMYVRECDLADDDDASTTKLLVRTQILHQMGLECKVRRLLCLQQTETSPSLSVSSLLRKVQAQYHFSSAQLFDDVVVIPQPFSFEMFDETITNFLKAADLGLTKNVAMLTTVEEVMKWPYCTMHVFQDVAVSVFRAGVVFGSALQGNAARDHPCSKLLSLLDLLSINIEERTRSAIFRGMTIVDDAWARVLGGEANNHSLQRIDTTLVALSSSVVELCLVLPNGTSLTEVSTLRTKLLSELVGDQRVRHAVGGSSAPGLLYFSLCTALIYTPVFCVRMTTRSEECGSGVDTNTVAQLEICEHQLRMSRELFDIESYSVLTALLRAILLSRCSNQLPRKCQLTSLVTLTSERLILQCFGNTDSIGGVDAIPTAADVMSGRIIYALYRMLTHLSKLSSDEWSNAFGTSLQALQGNEKAQAAWIKAMENIMQDCAVVMASYRCVKSISFNPVDQLKVLVGLIKLADSDATSVRASVEVSSHFLWSQVHSFALCDKLRHTATTVAVPQDNDERDVDSVELFSCAPSLVARRVDVVTSSVERLRIVMAEIHALDTSVYDGEGAFPGNYTYVICQEETRNQEVHVT